MSSNAFSGVGTEFQRGDGASAEVFTKIAEINSISGPNMSREVFDVTSLDSTGGYRELRTGFRTGGEVTLEMNFTLDAYDELFADFSSDDPVNYKIVLPDSGNTTFAFAGLVTACPIKVVGDDKVTATVTIQITGQVDLAS